MNSSEGNYADDGDIVATSDMCHYCFDILLKELIPESALHADHSSSKKKAMYNDDFDDNDSETGGSAANDDDLMNSLRERLENLSSHNTPPAVECPLFVTWSKLRPGLATSSSSGIATPASTTASSSNIGTSDDDDDEYEITTTTSVHDDSDYDLRGCIGTLAPRSLNYALSEFAITSALHDHRFNPIALHELPLLRVGVSLLVKYEECEHCFDWEVGVHGIIIKFDGTGGTTSGSSVRKNERGYSATYLPEVAHEQRWSQREAVTSLVRKAGYRGVIGDELLRSIRCTRYQSSKCRLSYGEYAAKRHGGLDPLRDAGVVTAAAVDEAMRQRARSSKPCVHL
mmetsp:Transcript_20461/g.37283  ORF Transcript_20461/g.37283 Transcript_20461/m.37283 type:complete len:342 (-) Transcript_20461:384-1409(-)|eukprot:CAMPEP_0196138536 /NCGR_PEP_ID=MMETSP0910-20130528/6144_1 /TAXON_ID=49265 /ORGANISM="Thalassiosira rotula, Strain GSO102" /LENGTH=341 /DNA_ID=CAMNT_0041399153 /DNA_START=270 /DNA_END=1295 /DNA_ORIENTATION=-